MNRMDEDLSRYLDGEMEATEAAVFAAAAAADPALAQRIAAQQRLRAKLQRAFDRVLNEPLPQRLIDAAHAEPRVRLHPTQWNRRSWRRSATTWLAVAASLAIVALLTPSLLRLTGNTPNILVVGKVKTAGGELARALSTRLVSEQASPGRVQIGISFIAKNGEYCRSFVATEQRDTTAGLACRREDAWRIEVLEPLATSAGASGEYRQAASALTPQVLQAVETRITGVPLDAAGEAKARDRGWQ